MKKKNGWKIFLLAAGGICVACTVIALIALQILNNQPPSDLDPSGYYIRGGKVYYKPGFPNGPFLIENADAKSFKILESGYGIDKSWVYFLGTVIPDADLASFEVVNESSLSKDNQHVYLGTEIVSDDPSHFKLLADPISMDSQHVYWDYKILSSDPEHFVILKNDDYYTVARDSQTIYVQGHPLPEADPQTFQVLQGEFARDYQHVFYFDQIISNVDLATFEVIDSPYGRDTQHVFWMEKIIDGADPETFTILNLDFQCATDQTHAYYQNLVIVNADPLTFPPNGSVTNCTASELFFSN